VERENIFLLACCREASAAWLKAMSNVTATVMRDGGAREMPLSDLVPGGITNLSAGDMIPVVSKTSSSGSSTASPTQIAATGQG